MGKTWTYFHVLTLRLFSSCRLVTRLSRPRPPSPTTAPSADHGYRQETVIIILYDLDRISEWPTMNLGESIPIAVSSLENRTSSNTGISFARFCIDWKHPIIVCNIIHMREITQNTLNKLQSIHVQKLASSLTYITNKIFSSGFK